MFLYEGEGHAKRPRQTGRSVSPHRALLRQQENKHTTPRDEKTASIRSYPKRLSPTILSDDIYSNLAEGMKIQVFSVYCINIRGNF